MGIVLYRSTFAGPSADYLDWVRANYPRGCFNIYRRPGVCGPEFQVIQE